MGFHMQTVQMTLDSKLVNQVDRTARRLGLSRSAFTRRALTAALERLRIEDLERRQAEGYRRNPVRRGEFDAWGAQQVWPD
jgi:metal-responsive CopG/Arc/MetJ family transcriptional regulator